MDEPRLLRLLVVTARPMLPSSTPAGTSSPPVQSDLGDGAGRSRRRGVRLRRRCGVALATRDEVVDTAAPAGSPLLPATCFQAACCHPSRHRFGPAPARSLMVFSAEPAAAEEAASEEEALPAAAGAGSGGEVSQEECALGHLHAAPRRSGCRHPRVARVGGRRRRADALRRRPLQAKQSNFKDKEEKKHRAVYETLTDSSDSRS
ncbi:hypothetical protein ACP70R_025535 [Stipagrostis hirtigluma subsp. patula]